MKSGCEIYRPIATNVCSNYKQVLSNMIRRLCRVQHRCSGGSNKSIHDKVTEMIFSFLR